MSDTQNKPNDLRQGFALLCEHWKAKRTAYFAEAAEFRRSLGRVDETGHTEMSLSDMTPGDQGHVLAIHAEPEVRQHLLEMGFTSNTVIEFVRMAPLSDPITVRVRGYQLSLRRREAEAIWVRRCPSDFEDAS